jgi:hypothetical protein
MSRIRSVVLLGATVLGAGAIALVGASTAAADGLNLGPNNHGLLNGGTGNSGIANNLLGPGTGNNGIANGLLGGSFNQGVANLGNNNNGLLNIGGGLLPFPLGGNTGVANIGTNQLGAANIGSNQVGLVQIGNGNLGAVNVGNGRVGILRLLG